MTLNTDIILQRPPFNLTAEKDRLEFMQLAQELDVTLDNFLLGKVYKKECTSNPEPYTEFELDEISEDIANIYDRTFSGPVPSNGKPEYTFTLGAPLTGKSTFMEAKLVDSSKVYVDPDRQSLQFMNCYKKLAATDPKLAYETYRDASNYICNLLMVWAIYKKFNIVHGTTGTNPRVAKTILPTLKKLDYTINAHVLFAPAESRRAAGIYRNEHQKFYQSTPADEKGKVAPVFARIRDAILPFADHADFYWNSGAYWLNTNQAQSDVGLRKFASFDRAKDPINVVGDAKSMDIKHELCKEVMQEIPAKHEQDYMIAMFGTWFATPEFSVSNYLPAFNSRNAATAAAAVTAIAAGIAYITKDRPAPGPT